jgi:hypothetical protein
MIECENCGIKTALSDIEQYIINVWCLQCVKEVQDQAPITIKTALSDIEQYIINVKSMLLDIMVK